MKYSKMQLFGGGITSDLPANWKDLSDVRPIPDHQECFTDSLFSENPQMLVVEILERQEHVEDDRAAEFFFNELAQQNDALQTKEDIRFYTMSEEELAKVSPKALLEDDSVVSGMNTVRICAGSGVQKVAMGRDFDPAGNSRRSSQEIKSIRVDLYVFRFSVQETDLVVSISTPVDSKTDMSLENLSESNDVLAHIVSTFRIQNWDLFG